LAGVVFVAAPHLGTVAPTAIAPADIETWTAPCGLDNVEFATRELQAVCPVTGQPKVYAAAISYVPGDLILESKALKLYLNGFRDHRISAEALTCRIRDDLAAVLQPRHLSVRLEQNVPGGLALTATASYDIRDLS
jgi:7-cyano-7-deazaguanine reductase